MAAAATIRIEPGHCISSAPIPALRFMELNEKNLALAAGLEEQALAAGLRGAEWCRDMGLAWCADAYNGIGPEFFPPAVREKVTKYLTIFEPAAYVHDCCHKNSDGLRDTFYRINGWFLDNCLILADRAYSWYNWKRYRARAAAYVLYEFVCSRAGWVAWCDSHAARVDARPPEVAPSYPSNTTQPQEGTCT